MDPADTTVINCPVENPKTTSHGLFDSPFRDDPPNAGNVGFRGFL